MDNLPPWIGSIAAVAVGILPGLAILSAHPIAGLSTAHCGRAGDGRVGPNMSRRRENRLGFQLHEGGGPAPTGLLTAAVLGRALRWVNEESAALGAKS